MPVAAASAARPPSSAATRSSSAATVGIRNARIDVAERLQVEERRRVVGRVEHERRRLVDRQRARAGRRVRNLAGVQAERVEAELAVGHGARPSLARRDRPLAEITPVLTPAQLSPPMIRACSIFTQRFCTTSSPAVARDPRGVVVADAELHPQHLRALGDGFARERRHLVRLAEAIDDVDGAGDRRRRRDSISRPAPRCTSDSPGRRGSRAPACISPRSSSAGTSSPRVRRWRSRASASGSRASRRCRRPAPRYGCRADGANGRSDAFGVGLMRTATADAPAGQATEVRIPARAERGAITAENRVFAVETGGSRARYELGHGRQAMGIGRV